MRLNYQQTDMTISCVCLGHVAHPHTSCCSRRQLDNRRWLQQTRFNCTPLRPQLPIHHAMASLSASSGITTLLPAVVPLQQGFECEGLSQPLCRGRGCQHLDSCLQLAAWWQQTVSAIYDMPRQCLDKQQPRLAAAARAIGLSLGRPLLVPMFCCTSLCLGQRTAGPQCATKAT